MSTEAHAEVHSREVDVLMLSRGSIRMAAEGEWTTAETERERERERRKTNAPRTPRRRARRLRPERRRRNVGTQRRTRRERRKTRAGVGTEAGARKSEGKRGEAQTRAPHAWRAISSRREAAHACEREHERREVSTNACIDGIARCRWCMRNVSAAAVESRRRKCPSAVRRANMEGGRRATEVVRERGAGSNAERWTGLDSAQASIARRARMQAHRSSQGDRQ